MVHGLPEWITLAGAHSFKMKLLFMYVVTANPELNENSYHPAIYINKMLVYTADCLISWPS